MKTIYVLAISIILLLVGVALLGVSTPAKSDGRIDWDGNGSQNLPCEYGALWILAPAQDVTSATIYVNGDGYEMMRYGNNWKAESSGYLGLDTTAYVLYTGDAPDAHIQLSHCIDGSSTPTWTSVPPTITETPSDTPTKTPTDTQAPTDTPTRTPTSTDILPTPTSTDPSPTPTATSTQASSSTPQPTYTNTPIITPTQTSTMLPTETPTGQPTITPTTLPTGTPTVIPSATSTPRPPAPAVDADIDSDYPGEALTTMVINGDEFTIYLGVNAPDGTLALPSHSKGAALYNNVIWVHRMWGTGWVQLDISDTVIIDGRPYTVVSETSMGYGIYPKANYSIVDKYIASCYSDITGWLGVKLYKLKMEGGYDGAKSKVQPK